MARKNNYPFMSIVVIGYNDAPVLHRTFTSLMAQDYPKDRYEVIFINDGSTDATDEVIAQFPAIRYIKFDQNKGIPMARTAGLEAARGEIYVGFDSDCVAEVDWLRQIARGYQMLDRPAGIGGVIVDMETGAKKDIATSYIEATGRGATQKIDSAKASRLPAPLQKLKNYLTSGLATRSGGKEPTPEYSVVDELYGANSSFPIEVLHKVGGWDFDMAAPGIGGIEDREICVRIRRAFPERQFYAMSHAKLMHEPGMSLSRYLLRPWRRGRFNYLFHAKNRLMPPIFPFPPLIALALLAIAIAAPYWLLPSLVLLPQVCYFWWLQRTILERRPLYMLFPYIQMAEETMVIAGLIKGFMVHNIRKHETR